MDKRIKRKLRTLAYARVSTQKQNLGAQIAALNNHGYDKLFTEKASAVRDRPELEAMLKEAKRGDTIVVFKLDRLGRSVIHLKNLIDELGHRGILLKSLNENFNQEDAMGKFMFNIIASLAELEREIIIERTKAGLEASRARGKKSGRKYAHLQHFIDNHGHESCIGDYYRWVNGKQKKFTLYRNAYYRYRKLAQDYRRMTKKEFCEAYEINEAQYYGYYAQLKKLPYLPNKKSGVAWK